MANFVGLISGRIGKRPPGRSALSRARGAALLEFAIVIPFIILLSIWVGTLGFAISQLVWLSESSYAAALAGAEDRNATVSTAESSFLRFLDDRHGGGNVVVLNGEPNANLVAATGSQSPLVSLGVSIGSQPLGALPSLNLGLTTVVARLAPGGNPGDLSEPEDIYTCAAGWNLECGNCGEPNCGTGGEGDSEGELEERNGSLSVTRGGDQYFNAVGETVNPPGSDIY